MSQPGNVNDLACQRAKTMSLTRNVHDLGVNVQKMHVAAWKRAGLGCQRAKNRCRYLETCRTWVPTCKKPMSLPENVKNWGTTGQKTISFPGNCEKLEPKVQKTKYLTEKR